MFNFGSLIKKPIRQVGGPVKLPKKPSGGMVSYQTEGPPSAPEPVRQAPIQQPPISNPIGSNIPGPIGSGRSRFIKPGLDLQRPNRYRETVSKFRL